MAATSGSETGSGFDHILKNTEFENGQQLKAIKAEQERIQSCQSQLKEKQTQIVQLEKSISDLDEHAKQLHKQFLINRDNCESLKRTAIVLSDHEEALKAKLIATHKKVETEQCQQREALSKYDRIWETYKAKYAGMEKAQSLKRTEEELKKLRKENTALEFEISQKREALFTLKQQETGNSLVTMVLKMATLHVETKEVLKLLRTENTQIPQLEEEIGALKEKITMEEVKRQKRREQHQDSVMEVDSSPPALNTESHQTKNQPLPPSATSVSNVQPVITAPKTLPPVLQLTAPPPAAARQSTTPSRYQLEIPKLSIPPHLSSGRHQISMPARNTSNTSLSIQSPAVSVASSQLRSNFQVPSVPVSTPQTRKTIPRPSLPLLHTPIQQKTQTSSFPLQTSSRSQPSLVSTSRPTAQISLSLPTLTKSAPATHTLTSSTTSNTSQHTSQSQSEQTNPQIPVQQTTPANLPSRSPVGQNTEADRTAQSEGQAPDIEPSRELSHTVDNQGGNGSDCVQVEPSQEFNIQNSSNSDASFSNLFSSDNSQSFPDFGGDFGQDVQTPYQENVNKQIQPEFNRDEERGLYYGLEGSLDAHGNQPDMSAAGDMFTGSGFGFDQSATDTSGGFNLFSSDGAMEIAGQVSQTAEQDFSFSFGGDGRTSSSSFSFF